MSTLRNCAFLQRSISKYESSKRVGERLYKGSLVYIITTDAC